MTARASRKHDLESLTRTQLELSGKVDLTNPFKTLAEIRAVAGLDVHFAGSTVIAAGVVLRFPGLSVIEQAVVRDQTDGLFPYIPGFLSFRELPSMLKLVKAFRETPDVYLCDGQGIAHPRRLGLASHLGVTIDRPTIGCAKSHLYGEYEEPPPGLRGAYQFLRDPGGDYIGIVLRTRPDTLPLFVSPGHKMDVETAGDIALACCTKYRIPEPLRLAHGLALNEAKKLKGKK